MTEPTRSPTRRAAILVALAGVLALPSMPALAHPAQTLAPIGDTANARDGRVIEVAERRRGKKRASRNRGKDRPRARNGRRYDPYWHPRQRGCRPRRAIRKAWRMGVDAPRIHRIGRRGVVVSGYRGRHYVRVRFGHARYCPIIAVRGY